MFIYPITIILIILNVIPQKYASSTVFKGVALVTFIFSIPDFLVFLLPKGSLTSLKALIPFANQNLGWLLPAILTFVVLNIKTITTKKTML